MAFVQKGIKDDADRAKKQKLFVSIIIFHGDSIVSVLLESDSCLCRRSRQNVG